jgi:hypothetical protein
MEFGAPDVVISSLESGDKGPRRASHLLPNTNIFLLGRGTVPAWPGCAATRRDIRRIYRVLMRRGRLRIRIHNCADEQEPARFEYRTN